MENDTGSNSRKDPKGKGEKTIWVIGGTTLLGIGVGFILLPISVLLFVASLLIGIGTGIVLFSFLSRK